MAHTESTKKNIAYAIERRAAGETFKSIGKTLGVGPDRVSRMLKEHERINDPNRIARNLTSYVLGEMWLRGYEIYKRPGVLAEPEACDRLMAAVKRFVEKHPSSAEDRQKTLTLRREKEKAAFELEKEVSAATAEAQKRSWTALDAMRFQRFAQDAHIAATQPDLSAEQQISAQENRRAFRERAVRALGGHE